jgi:hypothetical protein
MGDYGDSSKSRTKDESQDVKSVTVANKNNESVVSDSIKNIPFTTLDTFSKPVLSAELENTKSYNEIGQEIKHQRLRYIILGNESPDSKFGELKKMCTNVHWIHVEEGSFLWRDSKSTTDIILRYVDETRYRKYDIESVMEQNDRTM